MNATNFTSPNSNFHNENYEKVPILYYCKILKVEEQKYILSTSNSLEAIL